jgi:hypothetical protein
MRFLAARQSSQNSGYLHVESSATQALYSRHIVVIPHIIQNRPPANPDPAVIPAALTSCIRLLDRPGEVSRPNREGNGDELAVGRYSPA